ncbi:MAG: hypothetical protein GC162_14085 [Planctomycetes bacterium]|nr:hypothetical protein [Planctomycetota bacterium]
MKNASDYAKHLSKLISYLHKSASEREVPERPPLEQLVHSFLCWESSHNQADQAFVKLMREVVDFNDLRVTDPAQIVAIIGSSYSRAEERAYRLSRALHAIYRKEHAMDLSRVKELPKREAREYLEGLEGMPPFVAASVVLLSLDGHAMPVDDQLLDRLKRDGIVDEEATMAEVQSFLETHIRAADGIVAYVLMRAYVERPIKFDGGAPRKTTKKSTKKSTQRPTKKSTTKKKATR